MDNTRRVVVAYRRRFAAVACRHQLAVVTAAHDARRVVVVCHRRVTAVACRNQLTVVAVLADGRAVAARHSARSSVHQVVVA